MRCAILARKSNQQEATGDEKSVAVQERECRALIERNGWTLADGHLYVEDVVSGALMTPEGRPELFRLLAACEAKQRPFDIVVVSHEDRIGRDTFRSSMVIMRIIESGVRLVSVASGERKLDTPTDELLLAISGFMGSAERHSVSRRVRAKAFDNARRGHTTGLRAFGYESVEVNGHKELRVNAAEGEIVRWIFDLCQQGYGIRRIAHRLNEQHSGLHRWSHTGVRDILKNEIYIGQVVYGRTRNEVRKGVKRKAAVPEAEWVRVERPELRIVPQPLWDAAQARKAATFAAYPQTAEVHLSGPPSRSVLESKYLLAGMLRCGVCNGKLISLRRGKRPGGKRHLYYACWTSRGPPDARGRPPPGGRQDRQPHGGGGRGRRGEEPDRGHQDGGARAAGHQGPPRARGRPPESGRGLGRVGVPGEGAGAPGGLAGGARGCPTDRPPDPPQAAGLRHRRHAQAGCLRWTLVRVPGGGDLPADRVWGDRLWRGGVRSGHNAVGPHRPCRPGRDRACGTHQGSGAERRSFAGFWFRVVCDGRTGTAVFTSTTRLSSGVAREGKPKPMAPLMKAAASTAAAIT